MASSRRIVGPFNRVEGDLEVQLEIGAGQVRQAWVNSPLYRGFEQILLGKTPSDALVYAPRICGICSVSQSIAAARALAATQQLNPPRNAELAANLILAGENMADHFTHFYLFFMPDFARDVYRQDTWHASVAERFRAQQGEIVKPALQARAELLHMLGLLAGKWPHSLTLQPGGSARSLDARDKVRLLAILAGFRQFLERQTFAATLETIVALDSPAALSNWYDAQPYNSGDLRRFLHLAEVLQLDRLGRASDVFMSYGAYPLDGSALFPAGVWNKGLQPLDLEAIAEDLSHSWLIDDGRAQPPALGSTCPDPEMRSGYSWCKAPRLQGQVVEVGALARQMVAAQPLLRAVVATTGGNVYSRVLARLWELARVLLAAEEWVKQLQPGEPFCVPSSAPKQASGVGLVEAARGSLGHWLEIRDGVIHNYQIIAPTTWNFSPRDASSTPGALEQALVGTPVRPDELTPVAVQHVVRSFDPCMVCTVH